VVNVEELPEIARDRVESVCHRDKDTEDLCAAPVTPCNL
jgi:hypothetical protein